MLRTNVERAEDVHDLAATLIHQAERCIRAGLVDQAVSILHQVWTIAPAATPALADEAAWQLAWLALQRGAFDDAAAWFERVNQPPPIGQQWPAIRAVLLRICRDQPAAAVIRSPLPPLQITSLGRFGIARDHVALPPCTARKAIAIFRYLLTRRFHMASKEELMELLWPAASPSKAAHNLQVAISALRRHLDPAGQSYVLWEHGSYRLAPDAALQDDRRLFLDLCASADRAWHANQPERAEALYAEAVECYLGDYYVDDADATWAIAERERLLTLYLVALERLGDLHQARDGYEAAIACYLRLVERDTFREDIFCHLMRCFWQLGRRADALRQYQRIADTLRTELGLAPGPETQALHASMLSSAPLTPDP